MYHHICITYINKYWLLMIYRQDSVCKFMANKIMISRLKMLECIEQNMLFFKCLLIVHENCIASVVEEVQQVSLQTHTLLLWMELDFYTNCFILTTVIPDLNIVMSIWQASTIYMHNSSIIVECSASPILHVTWSWCCNWSDIVTLSCTDVRHIL